MRYTLKDAASATLEAICGAAVVLGTWAAWMFFLAMLLQPGTGTP